MNKMNKKLIIIVLCSIVVAVSLVSIFIFSNNKNENKSIAEEKTQEINNNESELSEEVINDLKNNLGKGTNGDVASIEQRKNDKGEDQYIFTYNDGTIQTITIKDRKDGSGIEDFGQDEDKPQEEIPEKDEPSQEEPQEDLGTVFERYINMSKREKFFFYRSFDSQSEFVKWYEAAQEEYSKLHPTIELGEDQYIVFGD